MTNQTGRSCQRSCGSHVGAQRFLGIGGALILTIWLTTAIASPAQTFKTLLRFDGTNGDGPSSLVQGRDGNLYGTTGAGGASGSACNGYGCGTVFKITPAGKLTRLYSFQGADGWGPVGLVQGTDGNFYGTTYSGGASGSACGGYGCGTVFKITPAGALTTIYNFCSQANCADGEGPFGVVQGTDGNFYGTTTWGGTNEVCPSEDDSCGTVFKITPAGKLTTLYNFCSQPECADGDGPEASLIQAVDGNFYGTTWYGGTADPTACGYEGCGTVFKITPAGKLTTLYSFCPQGNCYAGFGPSALLQGSEGSFYGTTYGGGAHDVGMVFKITPAGKLTTLYSFCSKANCTDGEYPPAPSSGLIQATDGNLYGTTEGGGASGLGTVFKITRRGTLTALHSFDRTDGISGLSIFQATSGTFYGTTGGGNAKCNGGCGTIFSLSMGLGPFVTFVQPGGKVRWKAEILGQGFTGTTGVSFNGTPTAGFTVKRDTYLLAAVPAGATTGPVTVTTPGGTLTSNVPYRVLPTIVSFSPTSGPVGTPVTITGVSLTRTEKVNFGGVHASFTVNSDTQVTATVPSGAQSGHIAITTDGGKTWSTQDFTVTQ